MLLYFTSKEYMQTYMYAKWAKNVQMGVIQNANNTVHLLNFTSTVLINTQAGAFETINQAFTRAVRALKRLFA